MSHRGGRGARPGDRAGRSGGGGRDGRGGERAVDGVDGGVGGRCAERERDATRDRRAAERAVPVTRPPAPAAAARAGTREAERGGGDGTAGGDRHDVARRRSAPSAERAPRDGDAAPREPPAPPGLAPSRTRTSTEVISRKPSARSVTGGEVGLQAGGGRRAGSPGAHAGDTRQQAGGRLGEPQVAAAVDHRRPGQALALRRPEARARRSEPPAPSALTLPAESP